MSTTKATTPANFTVTYDALTNAGHDAASPYNTRWVGLVGSVTFEAIFTDHRPIMAGSYSPRPAGFTFRELTAKIEADGQLRDENGNIGVRLPANDPVFGLTCLVYLVTFNLAAPDGSGGVVRVDGGMLEAPAIDTPVNLATALTSTGAPSTSIKGDAGPPNVLSIGTVTSGTVPAATITGTSPAQTLNLTLPKGDTGSTGPANTLSIGTVTSGPVAATITGTSPNQTLNLTIPPGATGPANSLSIGTVTTGPAAATITGTAPSQTLNLTLPQGPAGLSTADATIAAPDRPTPADLDRLPVVADGATTLSSVRWSTIKTAFASWYNTLAKTLTNTTLTSPTINGGTISNASGVIGAQRVGGVGGMDAIGQPGQISVVAMSSAGLNDSVTLIPALHNALANAVLLGGTVKSTINNIATTPLNPEAMLLAATQATVYSPTATTDTIVIEVDFSYRNPKLYQPLVGYESRWSSSARDITIEVWDGAAWSVAGSTTNNPSAAFVCRSTVTTVSKARFTFTNFRSSTTFNVVHLYAIQSWNDPTEGYGGLMPRTGGSVHGSAARPPTFSPLGPDADIPMVIGGKGNADLVTPSQAPYVTLVPPPATATAAGRRGQIALAADNSALLVCVATGAAGAALWRRDPLVDF